LTTDYEGDTNVIGFLQANWLTLMVIAAILAMFVLLRNRPARIGGLDEIVGKGQPVIVEVFSNT
jgi:hypothetical protein